MNHFEEIPEQLSGESKLPIPKLRFSQFLKNIQSQSVGPIVTPGAHKKFVLKQTSFESCWFA